MNPTLLPAGHEITVNLGVSTVRESGDFETFSAAGYVVRPNPDSPNPDSRWRPEVKVHGTKADGKGGLPVVGTPNYFAHPSARPLSFAYDMKDGNGCQLWRPWESNPERILNHVANGGPFEAHNVTFEWYCWNMLMVKQHGWPPLSLEQCYCVMAKARRHSLPGKLATLATVLGTPGKQADGGALINKLTRPHTPTKNRAALIWTPETAPEDFARLYTYNLQDVASEDHAAAKIPDLTPYERKQWLFDQTVNARGVQIDVELLDAMLAVLDEATAKYTAELHSITDGQVGSVDENTKFKAWLATNGLTLPNMQAETIKQVLEDFEQADKLSGDQLPFASGQQIPELRMTDAVHLSQLDPKVRRSLQIRALLGSANVKKLRTFKLQVSADGRLRDQYMYCGADRTGRSSSGGVQLQNMTAKGPKTWVCENCSDIFGHIANTPTACPHCGSFMFHSRPEWNIESVEAAIDTIMTRSLPEIERIWGDPVDALCGLLRGLLIPKPGHEFICVDLNAIEAVSGACLSRCQWRIDVLSTHGLLYEMSASKSTGKPFDFYVEYKKTHGHDHPDRKKIGKLRELSSQYGGWIGAWYNFHANDFMTDDEIKTDILKWRAESPEIVEMWGGQFKWCGPGKWDYRPELHGLEGAAIMAIRNPGECYSHIDITYAVHEDILFARLPSGRFLKYHKPRLLPAEDKLRRGPCVKITFEGYNSNSQKGPIGWHRLETYGARFYENKNQAVCADIQFEGGIRCEAASYPIVMHTHDEHVAEVPIGWGSVDEMVSIVCQRSHWNSWWPIRASGWRDTRYQKD